jgi:hypothetical protein
MKTTSFISWTTSDRALLESRPSNAGRLRLVASGQPGRSLITIEYGHTSVNNSKQWLRVIGPGRSLGDLPLSPGADLWRSPFSEKTSAPRHS